MLFRSDPFAMASGSVRRVAYRERPEVMALPAVAAVAAAGSPITASMTATVICTKSDRAAAAAGQAVAEARAAVAARPEERASGCLSPSRDPPPNFRKYRETSFPAAVAAMAERVDSAGPEAPAEMVEKAVSQDTGFRQKPAVAAQEGRAAVAAAEAEAQEAPLSTSWDSTSPRPLCWIKMPSRLGMMSPVGAQADSAVWAAPVKQERSVSTAQAGGSSISEHAVRHRHAPPVTCATRTTCVSRP